MHRASDGAAKAPCPTSGPAVNHQPEFTAACVTQAADQALFDGAVAMAWMAIDAASDAKLSARLMSARPNN
jgi:hypothetical protein